MKKNDSPKQPVRAGDIVFTVKFEDGSVKKMTAAQIAEMREPRRYDVLNKNDEPILRKTYRGI